MKINIRTTTTAALSMLLIGACSGTKESHGDLVSTDLADKNLAQKETDNKKKTTSSIKPAPDARNVRTEVVVPGELTEAALAHGVTKADSHVLYSAEVPGRIEYLGFDIGDEVKKGQVLARVDFKTLKAQADQAKSSYELAESTWERVSELEDDNLISRQQYDEARTNFIRAKAQLEIANVNLSKSIVRASHKGVVSSRYVDKAEYVSPGARLFEIVDYSTVVVEAQLAESQVAAIETENPVKVRVDALDREFTGKVDVVIPTADAVSRTFTVRVKIENPELEILVGMSAKLIIETRKHKNVLIVPQNAVIEEQGGGRSIFVVKNGKAEKRTVELGPHHRENVVIASGMEASEQLVVSGQRDLIDGQPVRVLE